MVVYSTSRFCRIRAFLITMIIVFSGAFGLLLIEKDDAVDADEATRGEVMGEWEELPTGGWPSTITTSNCEIMYREVDKELVVFNRESSQEWEVWSYFEVNNTWFKWNTSGDEPDARYSNMAFTSNPDDDVAYFFGGSRSQGWTTYTWDHLNIFFFSNKTWIEIDIPDTATGVYDSGIVYDSLTDSVWIFGGRDSDRNFQNDLLNYDSVDGWTQYDPSLKPSGRDRLSMSITPNGTLIHVSLGRYRTQGWNSYYVYDLWEYNVDLDKWREISSDLGFETDYGAIMSYRSTTDDLIISLGVSDGDSVNDTYIVNRENGSVEEANLTGGISGRIIRAWDLSADGSTAYVFGNDDDTKDFWSIDLYDYSSEMMPGNPNWAGGSAFTGYDPEDGGKLMALKRIGGSMWQLAYFSLVTKTWESSDLTESPGPSHSSGMAAAYDHINNEFYLYGGVDIENLGQGNYRYTHYDDFWKLDCDTGEWTRITEHAQPGKRGRATFEFDEDRGHLYLFGGQIPLGDTNSIYRYNISSNSWKSFSFTIEPQPRREHSSVFDQDGDRMFIFGGRRNNSGSNPELNDMWTFDVIQEQWQKMPEGDDGPTLQTWAGLSYNSHTKELLLMGDAEDEMFLWRENNKEWVGWIKEEASVRPEDWSGHGQAYSPETRMHYAWAHSGQQVWEYTPVLRTISGEIKVKDTDGSTMSVLPGDVIKVFPSSGTYSIEVTGTTDMPKNDLSGFNFNLSTGQDFLNVTWSVSGGIDRKVGNESWVELKENEISLTWDEADEWKFTIPFEVLFSAKNGEQFDFRIYPTTGEARSQRSQRQNIFKVLTDLTVAGYRASTPLQPTVEDKGWLFGRTDLTVSNFTVSFKDATSISPGNGTYRVWMTTSAGDSSYWDYIPNTEGAVTCPINGEDNEIFTVWLNLTAIDGTVLHSKDFSYKLDLDPPMAPTWAAVRADSITDDVIGLDNDNTVFLTWGHIFENGSGLKGVCYSLDNNSWPAEVNLTNEFVEMNILTEGQHTFYIWAIDNTSRAGPYITANVSIDTHMVNFEKMLPDPLLPLNVTAGTVTITVTITDEVSGVDPDSVEMQYSLPDRSLSDWMQVDLPDGDLNNLTFSVTHQLIPDMKNVIGFRATDLAGNDIRTSTRYGISYYPGLATPQAHNFGPENGIEVTGEVEFAWEGGFINPLNLSYQVHVVDPLGGEHVFETVNEFYHFTPLYPGSYEWWLVSLADGLTNQTAKMTFTYVASTISASVMGTYEADQGDEIAVTISLENPLSIPLNLSLSIMGDDGFAIKNGSSISIEAGSDMDPIISLITTEVAAGQFTLSLNITDDYGRYAILDIQIKLNEVVIDDKPIEDDDEGPSLLIFIIIGIIVLLIIIGIIAFMLMRKKDDEEEIEEEEGEKEPTLDYDPTGVVAEGGTGVEPSVHMAPGMLEQRESQSNLMEISLPQRDDEITEEGSKPPEMEE